MGKRLFCLKGLTFLLAFCSLVYELLFAQGLSAFLENTVLRYSVTIGLYMFSLGFGSLLAEGRITKNSAQSLLVVEMLLVCCGGFSVVWMHVLDWLTTSRLIFAIAVHLLILVVGLLSGMEIPLLIHLAHQERPKQEGILLGLNYGGAFLGSFVFAFVFYPIFGLMPSAFFVGTLNAGAALFLLADESFVSTVSKSRRRIFLSLQVIVFLGITACLFFHQFLSEAFINLYIG